MAGKFAESDGSNPYTFAINNQLPFKEFDYEERNRKVITLNSGSLKVYSGTLKRKFNLSFQNITESQMNSLKTFYTNQAQFRYRKHMGYFG